MAKIDDYNITLTDEQIKQKVYYYERQAQGSNWVTFKPGTPLEVRSYGFIYSGTDYKEFMAFLKSAVKSKETHILTFDDGTEITIILLSVGMQERAGEVNTVRGSFKAFILDGYEFTVDATTETIENLWGVE